MGADSGNIGVWALLCALAAVVSLALTVPAATQAAGAAKADRCRAQDGEVSSEADVPRAERSLLCLINVYRAAAGVPALPAGPPLAVAARSHSEDMVARGFYSHTSPDGTTPADRAAAAGYRGAVGESIAWLPRSLGPSPIRFFYAWRDSPENEQNLLDPAYRAAGVGLATGTPEQGMPGGTATAVLGVEGTDGTYTGLDMLLPAECTRARKKVRKAKKQLKAAIADGKGVRKARKRVKRRKAAASRACNPSSF